MLCVRVFASCRLSLWWGETDDSVMCMLSRSDEGPTCGGITVMSHYLSQHRVPSPHYSPVFVQPAVVLPCPFTYGRHIAMFDGCDVCSRHTLFVDFCLQFVSSRVCIFLCVSYCSYLSLYLTVCIMISNDPMFDAFPLFSMLVVCCVWWLLFLHHLHHHYDCVACLWSVVHRTVPV